MFRIKIRNTILCSVSSQSLYCFKNATYQHNDYMQRTNITIKCLNETRKKKPSSADCNIFQFSRPLRMFTRCTKEFRAAEHHRLAGSCLVITRQKTGITTILVVSEREVGARLDNIRSRKNIMWFAISIINTSAIQHWLRIKTIRTKSK